MAWSYIDGAGLTNMWHTFSNSASCCLPSLFSDMLLPFSVSVAWSRKAFEFERLDAELKVGCELQTDGVGALEQEYWQERIP